MYRRRNTEQLMMEMPFGVALDADNRWVKLSAIMPWEKIEERYALNFKSESSQEAKSGRLAFAALYIQGRLAITDKETVSQIQENPSMQYFSGFESYTPEKPFDSSLMVHFRKRITAAMMKEITEEAFATEAKKVIEAENDDDDDDENGGKSKPKGTLLLDATCCPSYIHYPTDIHLLNHGREITEAIIDKLHKQLVRLGIVKPRTYREVARKAYLAYAKKRKRSYGELRYALRQQLQYVRRNLDSIAGQIELGAKLGELSNHLYRELLVISELYRQQKQIDLLHNLAQADSRGFLSAGKAPGSANTLCIGRFWQRRETEKRPATPL